MRKYRTHRAAALLSLGLAATLLVGCFGQNAGTPGTGGALPPVSSSQGEAPAQPEGGGAVTVLLPSGSDVLEALLEVLAAGEGLTLHFSRAGATDYAVTAADALAGDAPPDLVLLPGVDTIRRLDMTAFADLLAPGGNGALQALAALVPEASRLGDAGAVRALPLGYYAQGYLVDLPLLAALLGAKNLTELRDDLLQCSWQQWETMITALEQYLQKPGGISIKLGQNSYVTPGYRPAAAQPLRGMFAVADAEGASLMQGAFEAAVNAPLAALPQGTTLTDAQAVALYTPSLASLVSLVEFETRHMTRREGAVSRGEAYTRWDKLDTAAAEALFTSGTALFYRADSRAALRLMAGDAMLEGRLVLVPVKLPLPPAAAGDDAAGEDGTDENNGASEELDEAEETEADPVDDIDVSYEIEKHNRRLWVEADGYLALAANAPNAGGAETLLLKLFATDDGRAALAGQLWLQPFGSTLTAQPLQQQLATAAGTDKGAMVPVSQALHTRAAVRIGEYVRDALLDVEQWDEAAIDGFFTTGFAAVDIRLPYDPDHAAGSP